jgi:DNA-binding transcriptional MerR regulator
VVKSYPRQDRARLTELIIRAQNPGISNKEIKALIRAGLYPKRFPTGPVQVELTDNLDKW